MFVLIGSPIYKRNWILPDWFDAILAQDFDVRNIGFVFLVSPEDQETVQLLIDYSTKYPFRCLDIVVDDDPKIHVEHPPQQRTWTQDRYKSMSKFRNELLDQAICREPDRYFSLDSDILLEDPSTIRELVQLTAALDAVSPLSFMTPDNVKFPNVMSWVDREKAVRVNELYQIGKLFQVDVIMAAVMMSKQVYSKTRYLPHRQGEDLGWSQSCRDLGFKLYSASYLYAPHIMYAERLREYKDIGDRRKRELMGNGWPENYVHKSH